MAEPGELSFGVVSRALLDALDGLVPGLPAVEKTPQVSVAHRSCGLPARRLRQVPQRTRFVKPTGVQHRDDPLVDASVQLGAGAVEAENRRVGGSFSPLPLGERGWARGVSARPLTPIPSPPRGEGRKTPL